MAVESIIIIIINRRSGITSHTSHGHKTGTRSMQPVRSVPLGGRINTSTNNKAVQCLRHGTSTQKEGRKGGLMLCACRVGWGGVMILEVWCVGIAVWIYKPFK